MMTRREVFIQAVRPSDVPLLRKYFPEGGPDKHAERLGRQQQGVVTYLIAWHDELPVGHGMVKWSGVEDDRVVPHLKEPCPDLEDLRVLEKLQSQGIGTQILQHAEELARSRGYQQIGLSAGAESDDRARKLYERLGYRDLGIGEFTERYEYVDEYGQDRLWEGVCIYLTKRLE
jgi:GNAT superfamily N-acetyltransferase